MKDPTAAPAHDWNSRVYDECYKPNRAARLLRSDGKISYITNNYSHISFNVGPTLHAWIARHDPTLAESLLHADRFATQALGAGGAIAQAYNHMILPLSEERDIRTQVRWGARDFEYRYGRPPRGMWLPETAVDTRTLEALADSDISFTILAPHQCAAVCSPDEEWTPTPGGNGLDTARPYFTELPSGRRMCLVFYYGSIAHDIAFGGLLDNGDRFADALLGALPLDGEPRLLAIATDGETYGHHHRFGEMALARTIQRLCGSQDSMLTNISAFLEKYPPTWRCRIEENTSWSCAHGLERWRSDCGCHTGGEGSWHQRWRAPLRKALDRLRDEIDEIYERTMRPFCDSPWELRDRALPLYLTSFEENATAETVFRRKRDFLKDFCGKLSDSDLGSVLSLIEAQRMRMFMYTSCGWFFNDISGIETRQILAYAQRAIEHTASVSGIDLGTGFMEELKKSVGNTKALPTGYDVMQKCVLPLHRDAKDIAAFAALRDAGSHYYSFRVERDDHTHSSGDIDLRVGEIRVTDTRTTEGWNGSFAVVSTGGLDDVCRLSENGKIERKAITDHFYEGDLLSISKHLESTFELGPWRLRDLPADDKERMAEKRTKFAEEGYLEHAEKLLDDNQRLLVQLDLMGVRSSPFLEAAGRFVYRHRLKDLCRETEEILDLLGPGSRLDILLEEAHRIGISPDLSLFAPALEKAFYENLDEAGGENDEGVYRRLLSLWERATSLGIEIDRWTIQNKLWSILNENPSSLSGDLLALAKALGLAIPGTES